MTPKKRNGGAAQQPGLTALNARFQRLGLFQKTMILNSAVVLLGASVGTVVTHRLADRHSIALLGILFSTSGALITFAVNYLAFWHHFRPLIELSRALEAIRIGQEARGSARDQPTSLRDLVGSARLLLSRIEDDSLHFSARLLGSIESERRRIGSDLHDNVSQLLAAALLKIGLSERQISVDLPGATGSLESAHDLVTRALDRIKVTIYDLRPAMLDDMGLAAALRWYAKARADRPGLELVTRLDTAERLPETVETALYRVGQEALANAVKHSGATRIELGLEIKPGFAALTVFDNGQGFDLAQARGCGIGLPSMRERVIQLGGQLNVVSEPNGGTRVYAVVTCPEGWARWETK